jgi:hypothetical protein
MYAGCVSSIRAEKLVCGDRFFENGLKQCQKIHEVLRVRNYNSGYIPS